MRTSRTFRYFWPYGRGASRRAKPPEVRRPGRLARATLSAARQHHVSRAWLEIVPVFRYKTTNKS
jgi:hypothetical protein